MLGVMNSNFQHWPTHVYTHTRARMYRARWPLSGQPYAIQVIHRKLTSSPQLGRLTGFKNASPTHPDGQFRDLTFPVLSQGEKLFHVTSLTRWCLTSVNSIFRFWKMEFPQAPALRTCTKWFPFSNSSDGLEDGMSLCKGTESLLTLVKYPRAHLVNIF